MTKRTFTIIATIEDDSDLTSYESAKNFERQLQGKPFLLTHVFPGFYIPGIDVRNQHEVLTDE